MLPGRSRRFRGALAAVALAAAVGLAGCAGDGDGDGDGNGNLNGEAVAPNPISEAAAATTAGGTSRVAYEAMFEGAEGSFAFSAEGEVEYDSHRAHLEYDMSQLPESDDIEVRFDGPVVFIRFPGGAGDVQLPEGKEWIRLPPPEQEDEEAAEAPLELAGVQQDPTQFLRYLQAGATEVQEEEWTEEVRGAETTTYTGLIDLDRVIEHGGDELGADEEQRAAAVRAAEALREQLGGVPIAVTVSVDEDGLVRRILLSLDVQADEGTISALTTTEYYDFGTAVDVAPPPEEQVIDAADV